METRQVTHTVVITKYGQPFSREKLSPLKLNDNPGFSSQFLMWWRSLQPTWRLLGEFNQPLIRSETIPEDGWNDLCKGGKNGIFLVILCMAWWADFLVPAVDAFGASGTLTDMLDDLYWVMQKVVGKIKGSTTHVKEILTLPGSTTGCKARKRSRENDVPLSDVAAGKR